MRILASSESLISRLIGQVAASIDPNFSDFSAYRWDDQSGSPQVFVCQTSELHSAWKLGVIEEYANSSQFDRLKVWQGKPVFAVACDGMGFHGQHGRIWQTGLGNLYLSMAIPIKTDVANAAALQVLPAQSIIRVLQDTWRSGIHAEIKAPNDIIVIHDEARSPCKLAGILTELRIQGTQITQVRYGIGMNIKFAPDIDDIQHLPATYLLKCGDWGDADACYRFILFHLLNDVIEQTAGYGLRESLI